MPHAVFDPGSVTGGGNLEARRLARGIEPGGATLGGETKPALLLVDARMEVVDLTTLGIANHSTIGVSLKLSQNQTLIPGQDIPVGNLLVGDIGNANGESAIFVHEFFMAKGTVWAPRFVGMRLNEKAGALPNWHIKLHLDYEIVQVPWEEWLILWDQLDNVVDNSFEY